MKPAAIAPDYAAFLAEIKRRIASARLAAARTVNHELIQLYWDIGRSIVEKQEAADWGDSVVAMLAKDLQREYPELQGFSARNLWDIRRFYAEYRGIQFLRQAVAEIPKTLPIDRNALASALVSNQSADQFLRQLVAEIPWGHNLLILNKLATPGARFYYLRATAQLGWSRNVLLNQIKAKAYERAVKEKKTHNFALALPKHLAEQANEMLKSRYNLEFLGLGRAIKERELENRLISRLQLFILELGYGF